MVWSIHLWWKKGTGLDVISWAKKIEELGAGEILLTSIDRDGTKDGYDILLTNEIVHAVGIPVIASGGCGKPEDMIDIFKNTEVNAALAASIFHYETHSVNRVKEMIKENGINVRYWIILLESNLETSHLVARCLVLWDQEYQFEECEVAYEIDIRKPIVP